MLDFMKARPPDPRVADSLATIADELKCMCGRAAERTEADRVLLAALGDVAAALRETTNGLELHRHRLERVDGRLEALEIFLATRFSEYPQGRLSSPLGQEG